jgi:ribosomal protein S18 acetylase RimI-like enzyme
MKEVTIRKAKLEDVETLRRFEQGVITAERPFDPTLKEEKTSYYDIEGLIDSPIAELVVAEIGDELVGSGYARIYGAEAYLKHRQYSYIGFIYVEPEHRGKGIVDKILDALKQWSISQDITEIRLEVYKANARAIRAYEKAGFQQHMLVMRMNADQENVRP